MLEPISRRALWFQKLAAEVVRGITERIENGTYAHGAPIGTRDELAVEFVTSASVIDRAVESLREAGLVTEGENNIIRVAEAPPARSFEIPADMSGKFDDLSHILDLRIGIETQAAELAAHHHLPASMQAVRDAAVAFEKAAEQRSGVAQADYHFHLAIAEASGNPYIHDILDHLGPLLIPRMRIHMKNARTEDQNLRRSVEEHASIVDAIALGDGDAARITMRQHLSRSFETMRQARRQASRDG